MKAGLVCATASLAGCLGGSGGQWSSFQADAANRGVVDGASGPTDGIDVRWRFETDDAVHSSPAVAGNTVYIGSDDGTVYALAADDGDERWRFETDGYVDASPAVDAGTVTVGSDDDMVYALGG